MLFGWNLRAYEGGGVWYFNPMAGQLLFILGRACALRSETSTTLALHLDSLYPISKTDLAPARLQHFLALIYVVAQLLPTSGNWLENWPAWQTWQMHCPAIRGRCR
ncbi:Uncharacterized protein ABJ99_1659 [Pseudomonas syringae pv. cilantro]|uniref:Uncharacterized protein n=2 Tax=Pseudomonas syringae group TaxID=136849 RepID=A0A0N0XAN4_PSESX|nr:Uncharacterized protein ABJ99_1659 [Pseudomonas syringae pv. cilantro]KPW74808.1 Uncharacterized protein ALO76_02968 [Pseudomonas syringae pv. coriandricola]RMN15068.1 hypothetical protein ALQ65_02741 [Pseudomonas syringae pv. coriandricola]